MSLVPSLTFAFVLFAIDQFWLQGFKSLHFRVISTIQKSPPQIRMWPAFLFYVVMAIGYHFILNKKNFSLREVFLFGIMLYATFDLTNLAIFKEYPVSYALIDTLWGGFVVMISYFITKRLTN